MSRIEGKVVNWTPFEKKSGVIEVIKKLSEEEYTEHLNLLSLEQEEYLKKVEDLYNTNPNSELYNIISLVEQIGREFKKLK